MRTLIFSIMLIALLFTSSSATAAIDRLQREDIPRFAVGILNLYYNVCKGMIDYSKTVVLSLDDFPKAVATDVFNVGTKGVPGAYYMTKKEQRERERQKRLEEREERELEKFRRKQKGERVTEEKESLIQTRINP